jgi:hypothetical protein
MSGGALQMECSGVHMHYDRYVYTIHCQRLPNYITQVINIFISTADELFGPVTVIQRNGKLVKNIPWTAFTFKNADWERVNDAREIIAVSRHFLISLIY